MAIGRSARALAISLGLTSLAVTTAADAAELTVYWTRPVVTRDHVEPRAWVNGGFSIWDAARLPHGGLALLGNKPPTQSLFLGAGPDGIGRKVVLEGNVWRLRLVVGAGEDLWLVGLANPWLTLSSEPRKDAYVAKHAPDGSLLWRRRFSGGHWLITDAVPLPSGDLIVVGRRERGSWLARLDRNGGIVWEKTFGRPKGAALALLPGSRIAAVGFDASGAEFREDAVAWIFDADGNLARRVVLREDMNRSPNGFYGKIRAISTRGGAYIASEWIDPSQAKPVEVARIDGDGSILWKRQLPDTLSPDPNRSASLSCDSAMSLLPNHDALVGCSIRGRLDLYRLARDSGEVTRNSASVPECHGNWPTTLFLFPREANDLLILGTRPSGNAANSCTWLAGLKLFEG